MHLPQRINPVCQRAMIPILFACFISTGILYSCTKKKVEVQTEPPVAVKQLIQELESQNPDCSCHPYINHYIWRNQNVYVLAINDALNIGYVCDWIPGFYNSKGEKFSVGTGYESYQRFLNESKFIDTVWRCQ